MGARRETVDYVLAEYRGIIVEVYEVIEVKNNEGSLERWYKVPEYRNRWGFHGRRAQIMLEIITSINRFHTTRKEVPLIL